MSGKSLINSFDDIVNESLIGYTLTYPQLELHESTKVVLKPGVKYINCYHRLI
jgi:hypothetical protein